VQLPPGTRARDNARLMSDSPPAPHSHRVTLLIAIAGVLIAGYSLWRIDNTRDRTDAMRDRVQQLETANTVLRADVAAAIEREAKTRADFQKQWLQIADLPQLVKDLTASHDDLRARTERPQRAWTRAEALYLIELAQRRLNFDRDTATAITALESADGRLAALRDSSFGAVRNRIAKDIQLLRAVPEPDRAGVVARLSAIESQIESLRLKGVLVGQRMTTVQTADDASLVARAWAALTNTFSTMFVVHRLRDGNGQVVSLEEQSLRRQHLALLAFTARHAVLRNDQAGYRAAIEEMRSWIAQYFAESPTADSIVQQLDSLRIINIAPALPDISTAAQLLARVGPAPAP
jgi:uroporphyrin-III C-methyltransferase